MKYGGASKRDTIARQRDRGTGEMRTLKVGDPNIGRRHLAALDPEVFDPVSGRLVITYQTYLLRTPKRTILVDTCTGEDKGYAPPMDFPEQPWLDGFRSAGLAFDDI